MKTIRSRHLASAAIIALLALPAAALAQPAQSAAPAAPPATASSAMPSQSGKGMEERVENHIKQLNAQLHITPRPSSHNGINSPRSCAITPATWIRPLCSALSSTRP